MAEVQRMQFPIIDIGPDASRTNGAGSIPTNGVHTNGVHTNGVHTNGVHTNGVHTNGVHTNGVHTNGVGSIHVNAVDPAHVNGTHDGAYIEDPPASEPRAATLMLYTPPPAAADGFVTWQRTPVEVQDEPLPTELDPRFVMLLEPGSSRAKCFRVLRHRLVSNGDPRIIEIASALPGEGRTTCALNLALAIAEEASSKVLLVEANLTTPIFSKLFDYRPIECFAEQVGRPEAAIRPWIVAGFPQARLHVAGIDARASRRPRLDRALLGAALRELRQNYDYIVIDTPAALRAAEANLVAEHADGIVLVARSRVSRRRHVRRALEQLAPANVLGMCLLDSTSAEAR